MFDQDFDLNSALQESAMLATLSVSLWSPVKTDRDLRHDVASTRDAADQAFSVRKNILAGADRTVKDIAQVANDFRKRFYAATVPFGTSTTMMDRGPRMLANSKYMSVVQDWAQTNATIRQLVDVLVETYAGAVETARINLGAAFKQSDYPSVDDLRTMFKLDMDFMPIPARGCFKGLPDDTLTRLDMFIEKKLSAKAETVRRDLSDRAAGTLERAVKNLTSMAEHLANADETARKPPLFKSLFEASAEAADAIATYAPLVGGDERLDRAQEVLQGLGKMNPDMFSDADVVQTTLQDVTSAWDCFN